MFTFVLILYYRALDRVFHFVLELTPPDNICISSCSHHSEEYSSLNILNTRAAHLLYQVMMVLGDISEEYPLVWSSFVTMLTLAISWIKMNLCLMQATISQNNGANFNTKCFPG